MRKTLNHIGDRATLKKMAAKRLSHALTAGLISYFALPAPMILKAEEINNPITYCGRYLTKRQQQICEKKIATLELDWYASSVCNSLTQDKDYEKCILNINKGIFQVDTVHLCAAMAEDSQKMACLDSQKNKFISKKALASCRDSASDQSKITCLSTKAQKRTPANDKDNSQFYQSLEIKKD